MTEETAAPEAGGAEAVSAPVETAAPASARESVSKALSGLYDDMGDVREESAPTTEKPASGPVRGPDGKFAAKETTQPDEKAPDEAAAEAKPETPKAPDKASDAPAGFDDAAKAAWASAPPELKGAVQRRLTELERGLQGYQQEYGGLREYAQLARQTGTTLKAAMDNYVAIEKQLAADPIKGLQAIARNVGVDLSQLAGEAKPEAAKDQHIARLEAKLAQLEQGFGQMRSWSSSFQEHVNEQKTTAIQRDVEAFAASAPRFEELAGDITEMLRTGYAKDLADAYAKAERLNPLPPVPQPAVRTPEQQAAQTRKASLAVTGAPVAGSNPATRKPPSSARDAVRNALGGVGL